MRSLHRSGQLRLVRAWWWLETLPRSPCVIRVLRRSDNSSRGRYPTEVRRWRWPIAMDERCSVFNIPIRVSGRPLQMVLVRR